MYYIYFAYANHMQKWILEFKSDSKKKFSTTGALLEAEHKCKNIETRGSIA